MKTEPPAQIAPPNIKVPDDLLLQATGVAQPTTTSTMEISSDESDPDDDRDTKEHKSIISASTDIKGDFEALVEEGFGFDGVFAFSSRYALGDAPNPCLVIDGYGTIGLPLCEREAPKIASECALKGSANTGICEIPAEKIHFDNPAWDTWIKKTAGVAASKALTANTGLRPTFALRKLVIHDKTCPPTNYKERDDKTSRKIGDFIVILPSLFDGAQLQLSHAGQTKTINFGRESRLSTFVVAAYSGVEHALSSVTAGYRLSLVYEIVHTIADTALVRRPRPALPEMKGATQKLRDILLSWKQAASGAAPELLACLLQHRYTQAPTFGAKSLTGADALLMSHLRPLAWELKFCLYLAHVTATVSTPVTPVEYYDSRGCERCEDCEHCDLRDGLDEEFTDDGDSEAALHVSQVVDLRGMPVNVNLPLQMEDYLRGPVVDGKPDDMHVDPYSRRSYATRKKLYKRTAILIWLKNTAIDSRVSVGDVYDHALHVLRKSLTPVPTKREAKVVDALLKCCRTRPQDDKKMQRVMQALRRSAVRWNDVQLLLRALKDCGVDKNANLIGVEGFVSAYEGFGWSALKNFCGEVMLNDPSSTRRRALLTWLAQMGEEEAEVSAWCTAQTDMLHRALGTIDVSDIPWLMNVATTRGGDFFRDVIFPQLEAQKLDRAFWCAFSKQLHQNVASIPSLAIMRDNCVSELVRGLPAFPTKDTPYAHWQDKDSVEILKTIQLCIETQNEALCCEIFTKMRDAARSGDFLPKLPPWLYYAELSPAVIEALQSSPAGTALDGVFLPFFVDVVYSIVSVVRTTSEGKKIEPCPLSDPHKAVLAAAARKAGGISVLKQSLGAAGLTAHDSSRLQALALFIAKEFPRQEMSGSGDVQAYDELIVNIVRAAIDTFDTATLAKSHNPSDQMMSLVQFCFEVGARDECGRLLNRLSESPAGVSVGQHVSTVLIPFLPALKQHLVAQHLDFRADPYKKFAAAVIKAFVQKVMTPAVALAAQIQTLGCACADCAELRAFFVSDRVSNSFPRRTDAARHLEIALEPMRAERNSEKGKTLLTDLGDPATQEAVLGADYSWVHARIHGTDAAPVPAPVPPANAAQNSSAQNARKRRADAGPHANTGKKQKM
ncbi:hypothetical protein GGX14DRAFT_417216 [Mycena pura]|uniref:Uncharacterized protein n=1 Tax=Mycena pura TaxID=153505 RepID=A0AAD6YQR9_9AGAR|nr:hypothetical protein GGX14DRAFT_417216 [Mycena pura]